MKKFGATGIDVFEPKCKILRAPFHPSLQFSEGNPEGCGYLGGVNAEGPIAVPQKNMIQFVLAKTVFKFGLVNKPKGGFKGAIHAHLFDQTTVRRIVDVLTGQRVTATSIGP
jgi:hypothetical protein